MLKNGVLCGEYMDLKDRRYQEDGEIRIIRSLIIYAVRQILLRSSNEVEL
jgi:hypothetical protein